jgi:hypothetical protein
MSLKECLDVPGAEVPFRLKCATVRPIDRLQFKIVWPHKNGARWQRYMCTTRLAGGFFTIAKCSINNAQNIV